MQKIKILFVVKDYRGGVETFIEQMSTLDKKTFEIYFAFLSKDRFSDYPKSNTFYLNNTSNREYNIANSYKYLVSVCKLYRLVNNITPDIVVSFPIFPFVAVSAIKKLVKKSFKSVVIINNNIDLLFAEKNVLVKSIVMKLFKFSINLTNAFVFISEGLIDSFSKKYKINKKSSEVIHHSIDIQKLLEYSKAKISYPLLGALKDDKYIKIFSVARFEKQKDLMTLVKAFASISKKIRNARLFFLGDGPEMSKIVDYCKNEKILNKVYFLGWQKNPYNCLKFADLYIQTPLFEGFGMSMVEAMALKIPVISINAPFGPAEILENGKDGILVPIGDHKRLSLAILKLLNNKKLAMRYAKLGYQRSLDFDSKNMILDYEILFKGLVK